MDTSAPRLRSPNDDATTAFNTRHTCSPTRVYDCLAPIEASFYGKNLVFASENTVFFTGYYTVKGKIIYQLSVSLNSGRRPLELKWTKPTR